MSDLASRAAGAPGPGRPAPGPRLSADAAGAAALDRVLPEAGYRDRLAGEAAALLRLERLLEQGVGGERSRRFCVQVIAEAERVEVGLVDVGARGNKAFAFFAEAVTLLRWCAKALHALLHLRGRIRRYLGDRRDLDPFRDELDACILWASDRVEALLTALRAEAERLGLRVPAEAVDGASLSGEDVRWRLPQDLDVPATHDERDRIAEMANAFLAVADEAERVRVPEDADAPALSELARSAFGPAAAQELRVRMHAIQSTYDSVVAGTAREGTDPAWKTFRGYVSILLHLQEAVAYLLQAHARLAVDVRAGDVHDRAARLVDADAALRWALRFGLLNAARCFREARPLAAALLERATRVREVSLALPPGRKLHLRPAGLIVRVVQRHGFPVEMRMGSQTVDARQLMDVILLAAANPTETVVRFRGDERPLADLAALFAHRLGEEGLERLPSSLAYLLGPSRPS